MWSLLGRGVYGFLNMGWATVAYCPVFRSSELAWNRIPTFILVTAPPIKKLPAGPQMRADDTKPPSRCMKLAVISSPRQVSAFQFSAPREAGGYWEAEMKLFLRF